MKIKYWCKKYTSLSQQISKITHINSYVNSMNIFESYGICYIYTKMYDINFIILLLKYAYIYNYYDIYCSYFVYNSKSISLSLLKL